MRDPSLGQEHHAAVAPLEPHLQKHWLGLAKEHNPSIPRLRKSIQAGRLVTEEEMEDGAGNKQTNHVALINRLVRWLTSETCKAPVEEWDADRREAIKRDFQPLLEILAELRFPQPIRPSPGSQLRPTMVALVKPTARAPPLSIRRNVLPTGHFTHALPYDSAPDRPPSFHGFGD